MSFSVATLWVPSHYYTDDDDFLSTLLPHSWYYWVVNFNSGDKVHALRMCITLLREGIFNDANCTIGTVVSPELDVRYGDIIQPSYDNVLNSYTIALNVDVLDPSITWHVTSPHVCVTAAHISNQNSSISGSLVLHPDFPASEPCVLSHHSPFGGRSGVPFHGNNGNCYARPCNTLEFLLAYSIAKTLFSNPAIWLSYDSLIDQLLPRCLSMCLSSAAARSPNRMNRVYDELVYDNNEHFVGAQCFLLIPATSFFLIGTWPTRKIMILV